MFPLIMDHDAVQVSVSLPVPRTLRPDAATLDGGLPGDHAPCQAFAPATQTWFSGNCNNFGSYSYCHAQDFAVTQLGISLRRLSSFGIKSPREIQEGGM